MTMTTAEAIAAVEDVLAQLRDIDVAPLATAAGLPPSVAAGELITSAWGNDVVTELKRKRGANGGLEMWQVFDHAGSSSNVYGTFDNGITSFGPYTFPVRVAVVSHHKGGFGGSGTTWTGDILRVYDGAVAGSGNGQYTHAAQYSNQTVVGAYDVPIGSTAGFKTRTIFSSSDATPITLYYQAHGLYFVQRTDY